MNIPMRILSLRERPAERLVAELGAMVTPHLSDSLERLYAAAGMRPMHGGGTLAGPAFTVRTAPGDNLLVHKALELAEPGDVIVVDAGGVLEQAIIGDLMCTHAKRRGIAGIVIWGAIRDSVDIAADRFPVFAAGVIHRGPYKNGPGEINVPVCIGGMPVMPGDIVVGDADGLVAVPQTLAETVLQSARAILEKESIAKRRLSEGTEDRSWIDKALKDRGYRLG